MRQNYETTATAGAGANVGPGYPPNSDWDDPSGVTGVGDPAFVGFFEGGQQSDTLVASDFDFNLPPGAVIDGIAVSINGSTFSAYGSINISPPGTEAKDMGALSNIYGSNTDLWGAESISIAELQAIEVSVDAGDVSGGDGSVEISLIEVTAFWHIELDTPPADVPIRVDYKVYSRDGTYLGLLPNASLLAFSQDMNSAGSTIEITCGEKADETTTVEPILDDDDDEILTDDDLPILADLTTTNIALGSSSINAIFKNSNRIVAWMYNKWHPNGIPMFSGQVNKVRFKSGGGDSAVKLLVRSDGFDLNNFIARGYPFNYTTDITQGSQNGTVTVTQESKSAGWRRYGQTWTTGGVADNVGAIVLKLKGSANVTVSVYDRVGGNLLGSVTKAVAAGSATNISFEFPQLIPVSPNTQYFFAISVNPGKTITVYRHSSSATYAGGDQYRSDYAGGSGGGSYYVYGGDLYFITKYGVPTTTTTYSSSDPVSGMGHGILLDYNARGGAVTERNFEPSGLSLTYMFNQASIYDAFKKILEIIQTGYYMYIDLGTAEMDVLMQSTGADFTVVRGKDVDELDLELSIEQVQNYLLFTGGEVSPGVNLYRDYQDTESSNLYGLRTVPKTDNRVTQTATADAIGSTFIEENSDETQETSLTINVENFDTTLLVPGKTIGFRNFSNFIDSMILQIVRRDFTTKSVTLTLGRLPVSMPEKIQRINRGLLNEQTINNPSAPS